jgi:predicted amidophosphoribosyltransferase
MVCMCSGACRVTGACGMWTTYPMLPPSFCQECGLSGGFHQANCSRRAGQNQTGWICPVCGKGVAPNQLWCPCKSAYEITANAPPQQRS